MTLKVLQVPKKYEKHFYKKIKMKILDQPNNEGLIIIAEDEIIKGLNNIFRESESPSELSFECDIDEAEHIVKARYGIL